MIESRNEHTIAASCQVRGRGYWSGREVCVEIEPAPVGTGVRLVRSDLPGKPASPANVDYACDASFRTNLRCGTACFAMVEHLLAALAALEIDNCRVLIDGEELPGLDGSSRDYVEALRHAGLIVQARTRDRLVIAEPVRVEGDGCWLEALPSVDGGSHFEYRLSYDDETPIPPQTFLHKLSPGGFARAVAAARTFVTRRQAAALREQGLAGHVTPRRPVGFWRTRRDRQPASIRRRMRPSQDARPDRRPVAGRRRSDRPLHFVPRRTRSQRRDGPHARPPIAGRLVDRRTTPGCRLRNHAGAGGTSNDAKHSTT